MILLQTPMNVFESYCGKAKVTGEVKVETERGQVLYTSKHTFTELLTGRIILKGGYYYFVDDNELALMEIEEQEFERQRQMKIEVEKERLEAERLIHEGKLKAFKEAYSLPFEYTTKIKIVLSGLSINSNGCGSKKNTVFHVFVKNDVYDGRFKRTADSFLCSPNDNGKWTTLDDYEHNEQLITCKKCLSIMERWKK